MSAGLQLVKNEDISSDHTWRRSVDTKIFQQAIAALNPPSSNHWDYTGKAGFFRSSMSSAGVWLTSLLRAKLRGQDKSRHRRKRDFAGVGHKSATPNGFLFRTSLQFS